LKVTFLGTGTSQGVPVITCNCPVCTSIDFHDKRLRSSILIESEQTSIVVDTGPDFRQQMLRERVDKLDAILFTHEHKDHTAGMDDIRSFNFKQKKDMPIYAHERVLKQLKQEFSYVFVENKYPGTPRVETIRLENKPFKIGELDIEPIEVMHYKLPVFGFKLGQFAYITDAKTISEKERDKIRGLDVLVLNALQKDPHISHFTLEEAITMANELGAKQTYFTHISHKLGEHRDVEKELPDHIHLAYDGLNLTV
jgi:phosphoribosyl 1,2-cyclic phosphate phosphodiesterase